MKIIWAILIAVVVLPVVAIAAFVGYDIVQDRQHIVLTEQSVLAYTDWKTYPTKQMKPIFTLAANTNAKVKRIRHGKDYMAIKVQSENGQVGWIFYGQSSFKIQKATEQRLPADRQ
jgi:hypothetical protein